MLYIDGVAALRALVWLLIVWPLRSPVRRRYASSQSAQLVIHPMVTPGGAVTMSPSRGSRTIDARLLANSSGSSSQLHDLDGGSTGSSSDVAAADPQPNRPNGLQVDSESFTIGQAATPSLTRPASVSGLGSSASSIAHSLLDSPPPSVRAAQPLLTDHVLSPSSSSSSTAHTPAMRGKRSIKLHRFEMGHENVQELVVDSSRSVAAAARTTANGVASTSPSNDVASADPAEPASVTSASAPEVTIDTTPAASVDIGSASAPAVAITNSSVAAAPSFPPLHPSSSLTNLSSARQSHVQSRRPSSISLAHSPRGSLIAGDLSGGAARRPSLHTHDVALEMTAPSTTRTKLALIIAPDSNTTAAAAATTTTVNVAPHSARASPNQSPRGSINGTSGTNGTNGTNGSTRALHSLAPDESASPPTNLRGGSRRALPGVGFQSAPNELDDFNEEDHLPPLKQHFAPPKQCLFIHPQSVFKTIWSLFLILFIMYSLFEVPMSIGFGYTPPLGLKVIGYFVDCFFLVDVALNFVTGYLDEQLELVQEPKQLALSYLKGWFIPDIIGSIPFDIISIASSGSTRGTKAFFVLRALKIPRLFRVVKMTNVLDIRSHRLLRELLRMVKLVLIMIVIGHWIACGFMLVARSESDEVKTWAEPVIDEDIGSQYVFALYWSLTVLSTVGFGDIVPLTQTEMIYTCVVMLIGAILYAVVVGNVMLVLANLNAPSQRHTEEIMKVADYMRYRRFPKPLMKKVIDFTEAEWKRMRGYNEREVLAHLPESLQTEIARHLHAKMLTSVSMFKESHSGFINAVVLAFHTAMLLPNTIMIRRNQPGDKMFFVAKGSVELLDRGQVYAVLQEGSYVGETALLDGLYRVTARTATYCELCILYRSDFDRIVKNYPSFVDIVSAQAEQTALMAAKMGKLKALFS